MRNYLQLPALSQHASQRRTERSARGRASRVKRPRSRAREARSAAPPRGDPGRRARHCTGLRLPALDEAGAPRRHRQGHHLDLYFQAKESLFLGKWCAKRSCWDDRGDGCGRSAGRALSPTASLISLCARSMKKYAPLRRHSPDDRRKAPRSPQLRGAVRTIARCSRASSRPRAAPLARAAARGEVPASLVDSHRSSPRPASSPSSGRARSKDSQPLVCARHDENPHRS